MDRVADAVRRRPARPDVARARRRGAAPARRPASTWRPRVRPRPTAPRWSAAFVDGADGLETAGYCRTNHWTGGFASSAGQSVSGEAVECGVSGIARAPTAPTASPGTRRSASPSSTAPRSVRARPPRHGRGRDPVELPPGRYEVVLEPTRRRRHPRQPGRARLQRQGRQRAHLLRARRRGRSSTRRSRSSTTRWRWASGTTPRARRGAALPLVEAGTHRRGHARPPLGRRGRRGRAPVTTARRRFAFGPVARHLGLLADRSPDEPSPTRSTDRSATRRSAALVAGVERGILVSDFWYTRVLDPRTPRPDRPDPQRRLADRGRRGHRARCGTSGSPSPTPQALAPGNVLGVGRTAAAVPGDTYTTTSPRWSCPALHLASWNFTGGASG